MIFQSLTAPLVRSALKIIKYFSKNLGEYFRNYGSSKTRNSGVPSLGQIHLCITVLVAERELPEIRFSGTRKSELAEK